MPNSYPLADNIRAALRAYADLITKHNHTLPSVRTGAPPIISSRGYTLQCNVSLVFICDMNSAVFYDNSLVAPNHPNMYKLYKLNDVM